MKNAVITRRLIRAVIALIILIYFVVRTTSPKIIFAPFIVCCVASIGKSLGILFNKKEIALFFDKFFKVVFFLSWFTFLIAVCYIAIRDDNYQIILFTLPFWVGGLIFAKRKLLNKKINKPGEGVE